MTTSTIQIEPVQSNQKTTTKCGECNQIFPCDNLIYQNRQIENEDPSENLLQKKEVCCNMCCRTFFDLTSFKEHLVNKHKCQNLPEKIYTTLKTSGKFLCKFCKKKFQSNENLNKHMKKCVGRGGVICRKCDKLRFSSISELIEHNSSMHQYNGDFFEKVIEFNPKKKKSNDKRRTENSSNNDFCDIPAIIEYLNSTPVNLTELPSAINSKIKNELVKILDYEIDNSPGVLKVSLYSDIFGKRFSDEDDIWVGLSAQTKMFEINSPDEILVFCERILSIFLERINLLSAEIGSDITLDYISNITVKLSRCKPKFGGCGNMKIPSKFGGIQFIKGSSLQSCLRDAVIVGKNHKFMSEVYRRSFSRKCNITKCKMNSLCNSCRGKFNTKMSDIKSYPKIQEDSILNEIEFPSSMKDVMNIEKNMTGVKFHVFDIIGDYVKKTYSTQISNEKVKQIIPLVRIMIEQDSYHWAFISDLSLFLKKKFYNQHNVASISKNLLCSFCCSYVPFGKNEDVNVDRIDLKIKDILPYISNKKFLKSSFLDHLERCSCNELTKRVTKNEKYLGFTQYKAVQSKRYTAFLDFETFNSYNQSDLCNFCEEISSKCVGDIKQKIKNKCNHFKITECKSCYISFKSLASKLRSGCCDQNPLFKGFFLCKNCFKNTMDIFNRSSCNHSYQRKKMSFYH